MERLREVLGYRRLGFGLREIATLVDDPATDAVAHLRRLRGLLREQRDRTAAMVAAIDKDRPGSGRWTASATTFPRADGPIATGISSPSPRCELGLRLLMA